VVRDVDERDGGLHLLFTGRLAPADALASGACTADDAVALPDLLALFDFATA
jgi:hypothetical protein